MLKRLVSSILLLPKLLVDGFGEWLRGLWRWSRSSSFIFGILGGGIFLLIFYTQYADLDPGAYKYRDDGVITMSHAKNLVDHGHIGVDPSGKRLEGFSAPVQFWIYTVVYAVTGLEWDTFADAQTFFCTFLFGFLFLQFFRRRWIFGLIASGPAAMFMTWHHSFFEWHGSGMENPWTHVLFHWSVLILFQGIQKDELKWQGALVLFLASISRLDSIYHLAPLVVVWAFLWRGKFRSWHSFRWVGLMFLFWGMYQFWRWYYFGSLMPNTGLAQGIDVKANVAALWSGDGEHLRVSFDWARIILPRHGVWFLLPGLFLFPFSKVDDRSRFLLIATGVWLLTVFLNPAIFGMTRLDPSRSTTFLVPMIGLLLAWQMTRLHLFKRAQRWLLLVVPVILFAFWRFTPVWSGPSYPICCAAGINEEIIEVGRRISEENGISRLNVAAPDLGKLSYAKLFNLTDLGWLGSPLMAHFRNDPARLSDYFFEVAAPDLVEVHGPWCETYRELLSDPRFRERYEVVRESKDGVPEVILREWPLVREGIYVRKAILAGSGHMERELIDSLELGVSMGPVLQHLEAHRSPGQGWVSHDYYIGRTIYRYLPEFEDAGLVDELFLALEVSHVAPFDRAMLMSGRWRNWEEQQQ